MILAIKTDAPEAELWLYDGSSQRAYHSWTAHRQLAKDLLRTCDEFLQTEAVSWADLRGLVVFTGPGSFTGLRIGIVTIMSTAHALSIPAVGTNGGAWLDDGLARLARGESDDYIQPHYGSEPQITTPRK